MHCPPYRSSILIELYKVKSDFTIKMFYRNSTVEDLSPLNIPGCGTNCPLNKIFQIYKDILPEEDFNTECKVPVLTMTYEEANLNGSGIGKAIQVCNNHIINVVCFVPRTYRICSLYDLSNHSSPNYLLQLQETRCLGLFSIVVRRNS